MEETVKVSDQRRNRNYAETHRQLIDRAVYLIGKDGLDALSVATLARHAEMNRSTVYYHFDSRDALLAGIRHWVGERLTEILEVKLDPARRLEQTVQFVLSHCDVVNMWLSDLVGAGSVVERGPYWEILVGALRRGHWVVGKDKGVDSSLSDPEVLAAVLLAASLMAPQLFQAAVAPDADINVIAARFASAYERFLRAASVSH